jgi:DNA replicative helicase MCM subunit Mcm2 (Cdc46/Mcm family)
MHPCRKDWTLLRDDSIFVDWQRLKVQENVEEVRHKQQGCFAADRRQPVPLMLSSWSC